MSGNGQPVFVFRNPVALPNRIERFSEMDFRTIDYLKQGNERQQRVYQVLTDHRVLERLSAYHPILVGTIPLGIDIEMSDLDVICSFTDPTEFRDTLTRLFHSEKDFKIWANNRLDPEALVARFELESFEVEVFGQNLPTVQQMGYRHLRAEYNLLQERGEDFRQQIIALKKRGIKTEPAFAQLLGLTGNPYLELLKFE